MKRSSHSHLPYAALSDQGIVRDHNEDSLAITAFDPASELVPESLLCVLCDGVGGHLGGETASRLAVDQITAEIEATDGSSPMIQLSNAIQSASELVWKTAQNSAELRGMATTAACAWIVGKRLFIANVGDSRIYLIRKGRACQISVDHTWLQEALEAGLINRADFKGHPNAHVIKKYVGSETLPDVDSRLMFGEHPENNLQGMMLESGDQLFMCSDGVSDLVLEHEIVTLLKNANLDTALEALKLLVYQRGATDNLSMIVVNIPSGDAPANGKTRILRLAFFALIILLASFVGIYLGWLALFSPR
jgi:PPM family protein phosphatase